MDDDVSKSVINIPLTDLNCTAFFCTGSAVVVVTVVVVEGVAVVVVVAVKVVVGVAVVEEVLL